MTSFLDAVLLSKWEQGEDSSSGPGMSIRQRRPGRFSAIQSPSCHACYRPIDTPAKADYCESCEQSGAARRHRQMVGRMR